MLDNNPSSQLAVSSIVIYALLLLPAIYCLWHHGKHGIIGWAYLVAFCTLRIIGAALEIQNSRSSTAQIISAVGLSPLILAILGILHESSTYIAGKKPWPLGTGVYVALHLLVGAAIGLVVSGNKSSKSGSSGAGKSGTIVYLLVWIVVVGLCALSFRHPKVAREAKWLLYAVAFSLPFSGARILYTVIGTFDRSVNPYTGPIALRAILVALMEYVVTIGLVVCGVMTRNICLARDSDGQYDMPLREGVEHTSVAGSKH